MKTLVIGTHALLVFAWFGLASPPGSVAVEPLPSQQPAAPVSKHAAPAPKQAATPDALDSLLAPIALYPDQLLAQMLLCASNPGKVATLNEWLASQTLKGSELQDAATKSGFEASFAALVLFPRGRGGDGGRSRSDDAGSARRSLPIARRSSPASSG